MKILVLGAAGRTGREVVRDALSRGYEVVAFMLKTEKLDVVSNLSVVIGDAEDAATVAAAYAGCDAVISALGHTSLGKSDAQTLATRALIGIMPPDARFITLTGYGVHDEHDPALPLTGRAMNWLIRHVPGGMFTDGEGHVRLLQQSRLGWIIIRASRLASGPGTGKYELGYYAMGAEVAIARADVAMAMVDVLSDDTWLRQAPMIRP